MNISELFIRRPVMTTLVMLAIVIFGLMSYVHLPISSLPNVDYPFISVTATLPGATPETMASSIATPLERQFAGIAGLSSFNSISSTGSTNISLQFNFSRDISSVAKDVQAAISAAAGQLPTGMPKPPTYRKVNPSVTPIIYLYFYSDTLPIYQVDENAEITIGQPISMIDGVAQVQVYGQKQYAVRAQLDPQELATRGIDLSQVATALKQANVILPTGILSGPDKNYLVQANGQLENAAQYQQLIVSYKNGQVVRLSDLGDVVDSVQNTMFTSRLTDTKVLNHPTIFLAIQPQPGANTVEILDTVKEMLPILREQIPKSIEMGIFYDRSLSIRAGIDDVKFSLILSIGLVVMVIFIFLRDIPATIIPSLALPVAIIGTFAAMYLLGFSLDNISLLALTLSVGFVVDDAIVVLENIVRHRELGEKTIQAALKGSQEVSFTIVSMTLSLVAVFIPIIFMGGLIGRLFHEFAITISVAILISGFVSLSLTPMLCSRFLGSSQQRRHSRLYYFAEEFLNRLLNGYKWTLTPALQYRQVTLIGSFLILVLTFYLFNVVPKGFIPNEDTGLMIATTKAAQDISFDDMLRHQNALVEILRKNPNFERINSTVGASGPNASVNTGRISIRLKPRDQRKDQISADDIIQQLNPKLRKVTGIKAFLRVPPAVAIGGQQTSSLYQFTLQSLSLEELRQNIPPLLDQIKALPGLRGVDTDLQLTTPQIRVDVDQQKASVLGITAAQIQTTLGNAYGSKQISTLYQPDNEYYVILEVKPELQREPNDLSMIYITSNKGQSIPLTTIAKISENVGPLTVNHLGPLTSATISFDLEPGTSLSQATSLIENIAKQILPDTITTSFQGSAQIFQQSFKDLGLLLLVSIIVIYLILGILYEDFIHPMTILSGLPSAGFGALITLLIFGVELNLYSFIGIILLVGIVKKNGIMMVDFAIEAQRKEGKNSFDAIYSACIIRFRPIMMTTMAALIGTLPIALGTGTGSEIRRPLGIAVVGGLLFSQVLTLYLTPVFYTYMEELRANLSRFKLSSLFFR